MANRLTNVKSDGTPIKYEMNYIKSPELYNLNKDPKEKNNVADLHPNIVKKIHRISDSISLVLGNSLKNIKIEFTKSCIKIESWLK